jgi:hypothetical protein
MSTEELLAATSINAWSSMISRLEKVLSVLKDDDWQLEVAPGRNRVFYIVGHLAAFHDRLLPMLSLGDRLHPELDEIFIDNPDRTFQDRYSAPDLHQLLKEVNAKLTDAIRAMSPAELLARHAAVSEEEFKKEPLRNRLAVIQSRTAHVAFHSGQIRLIIQPSQA